MSEKQPTPEQTTASFEAYAEVGRYFWHQIDALWSGGTYGDGRGMGNSQHEQRGIDHSISPGVPCPETVLVAVVSNGSYLLVGYPQGGPTALVVRDDAGPLRQALEAAFGHFTDNAASRNGNSTEIAVPGNEVLHTTQARP